MNYNIKILTLILSTYLIVSCEQQTKQNYLYTECKTTELEEILNSSRSLLEKHLLTYYQSEGDDIKEGYIRYLKGWAGLESNKLYLDTLINSNQKQELISSKIIREIYDYTLNLGDTIILSHPRTHDPRTNREDELINQIEFNYKGIFAKCLRQSNDTIGTQFTKTIEAIGNINNTTLANYILNILEQDGMFQNEILQDIIVAEFYIEPILIINMEE